MSYNVLIINNIYGFAKLYRPNNVNILKIQIKNIIFSINSHN